MVSTPGTRPATPPIADTDVWPVRTAHVPPLTVSLSVTTEPAHTLVAPDMAPAGVMGRMVMGSIAVAVPQLFVAEYWAVSIPAALAVTWPLPSTLAKLLVMLQEPPVVPDELSVMTDPAQTEAAPEMTPGFGAGLTVT